MVDYGAIITYVLQTVLALAIPVVVAFAFTEGKALLQAARDNLWAKLTAQQQATVQAVAGVAVNMAEQIAKRDDIQNAAKAKFDMANAYVNEQLAKYGITLTAQEVEAQVEAAVREQLHNPPAPPAPAPLMAVVAAPSAPPTTPLA